MQTSLERLNSLTDADAEDSFLKCCGSTKWVRQMVARRPFSNVDQLFESADHVWLGLEPDDWLEAFHSHPKIGERKAAAATSAQAQKWSEAEQSGTRESTQDTIDELARLNLEYEQTFGFIFIICATGKTAEEMLASLRRRLQNNPNEELRNAADEQANITRLRLHKLIETL